MSISISQGEVLLEAAHGLSSGEERKCRAVVSLLRSAQTLQRALRRAAAPDTLTELGFDVLAYLVNHEPARPGELAQALALSRPALGTVLGRLEISGIITRERATRDRRPPGIRTTAAGRRAFSSTVAHHLAAMSRAMVPLRARDLAVLDRVCLRLHSLSLPRS